MSIYRIIDRTLVERVLRESLSHALPPAEIEDLVERLEGQEEQFAILRGTDLSAEEPSLPPSFAERS
jgi:hypothetical protein